MSSTLVEKLPPRVKRHLADITDKLRKFGVLEESTIILVGSVARGTATWRSDIDFLVIASTPLPRWRTTVDVSIILETRETFLRKLGEGNDLAVWAVRFGVLCIDPSGWWARVLSDVSAGLWPDWRLKVRHARKRQSVAARLLASGDWDAAEEEYLLTASHIARALLLQAHVFPLSRPEMPAQLVQVGLADDARLLDHLIRGTRNPNELQQIAISVEHRLDKLERLAKNSDDLSEVPKEE